MFGLFERVHAEGATAERRAAAIEWLRDLMEQFRFRWAAQSSQIA